MNDIDSRDIAIVMRRVLLIIGAVAVVLVLNRFDVREILELAQARPEQGILLTMLLYIACSVLLLPGSIVITVATGALYGFSLGVMVIWASSLIASILSFAIGRKLLPRGLQAKLRASERFKAVDAGVRDHGVKITLALRLAPVIPARSVNYLLAVTSIRFHEYALGSAIGILPLKAFIVFLGTDLSSIGDDVHRNWYIAGTKIAGMLVFAIAGIYVSLLAKRIVFPMTARTEAGH